MNWESLLKTVGQNRALMPTVREDHDPLTWLAGIGTGTLLAFIRWSDFRCPYCGEVFRRTYLPSGVMLGSGERTCPTCGKFFDHGFREWPEWSFDQKVQHLFPVPTMRITGGFLVCAAIAIFSFIQARGSVSWSFFKVAAVAWAGFLVCWSVVGVPGIRRSNRRWTERRDKVTRIHQCLF